MSNDNATLRARPEAIALLLILATCWIGCEALYEDQVGVWDWHREYIGKVSHAVFQTHGSGRKRVVVATEENALASLNLRTGGIYWRRVLGETDSITALELALGKYAISLSGDGSNLRAWNLPDGALYWESHLKPSLGSSAGLLVLHIDIDNDRANDLLVFSGGVLFAISSSDGGVIWKLDLNTGSEDYMIQKVALSAEGALSAVGFSGTSGLVVIDIDPGVGEILKSSPISILKPLSTSELLLVNGVAVALDSEGSTLVTALVQSNSDLEVVETPLSELVTGPISNEGLPAKLLPTKLENAISILLNEKVVVLKVDSATGTLSVLEEFPNTVAISHTLEVVDGKHAVSIVQPANSATATGEFSVRVVYSNSWNEDVSKYAVKMELPRGSVKRVFLNAYVRTDRSHGFRALVVSEDDALSLLQQGEVVWAREDGLASIIDTATSELPLEGDGHSVAEVEHNLADWLKGHWLKLKATLFLANAEDLAEVQAVRLNSGEKTKMIRDHNGFRKLLIVLTKAGKVLALHTGDGRVVWSVLLSGQCTPLKLLPWQVPLRHALDENPLALVLGKCGPGPQAPGVLSWVDLYKGTEVESLQLTFPVSLVIPLPVTTSTEERLHLFVDDHLKAHVFPRTEESLSLFNKGKPNTYFYVVNKDDGTIDGYTIKDRVDASTEEEAAGYVFHTQQIWSVVFPSETEVISTVVSRSLDEVVHTQTKILGNRDALYKYLSTNVIFVATVTPKAAGNIGTATPEEAGLVAYLIDTVTGRVLHRVSHPNMQGPVHAVFSENWIVYHYFNLKMYRYDMTVLELYDQNRLRDKGALQLMLGRHNGSAPVSSFSTPNIDVRTQSYFFPFTVKTMTVTSTARGITGKQLLIGTINDQVLALDKRYFDPRRTLNPTPAEREEGIMPLTDAIPIFPQSYLSHAHQVAGLRGIVTVPARLESTSLVFAYGLDLFYTQTAPSRIYDSLTEDFSYALLLITILALLIGIVVTYVWSEHKELAEKWQ